MSSGPAPGTRPRDTPSDGGVSSRKATPTRAAPLRLPRTRPPRVAAEPLPALCLPRVGPRAGRWRQRARPRPAPPPGRIRRGDQRRSGAARVPPVSPPRRPAPAHAVRLPAAGGRMFPGGVGALAVSAGEHGRARVGEEQQEEDGEEARRPRGGEAARLLHGRHERHAQAGISVLAECLDCPELKATADDFIHQHFTEVYKTDEFLQLDVKRVTHLLNQDTLTVRAEDQVYDAAVRWLKYDEPNRQPYMVDILAKVRFPLISKNFLSKTVQAEPLIQDNPECLKMVISGMRYHLLSPEDREELVEGTRPRRKKHDYRIALFGGSQPQSCRYFNPKDYSWTDIRCPFEKRRDAACVFWDNVVYILGGSQLFPIKRMDCYNVVKDSWYSKLGPPTPRDSLAACAAEGKIYTSGGSEVGNSALYLFECYDTRTESWHTKPSMLTQRCSHGMVEANGLIYVCGGSLGNNVSGRVLNSCEVYDPATETWTELCPMIEARKNHGLVFVKDKIFAVGGQNSLGGLDNVEYYDIKMNEWKMVSPMPWKGVTVKCAAVGSIVYVLAGFQGVGRLGHILEYNTETDKWIANSKVRAFPVTSCLICVVDTCGANEETLEI
ncbi:kelch-like protein 7 isoform X1 [Pyrgilauda ruficollis]|uniref:kelch-like protein 7 isoform X1 n=1 Tax=Pyrgilauda ruficollis TaxID=221976 RepID=UPI001B87FD50|nr:kelch-like protein 7 isoform X1 [Pyrgilauda ruficollis]